MELKENEYIFIDFYECTVTEDNYAKGEIGGIIEVWGIKERPIYENNFKDVKSALKAILDRNDLKYNKDYWYIWGKDMDCDYGRFDYDAIINENRHDATDTEIICWKTGGLKLYNLHICASLSIKKDFKKEDLNNIQL